MVLKADGLAAGKGVIVCQNDDEFNNALTTIFDEGAFGDAADRISLERCLVGEELSVFAICDGKDVHIAGIMQHIEEAGIHSGDSSCVYPPYCLPNKQRNKIELYTKQLALELNTIGLINLQFAI